MTSSPRVSVSSRCLEEAPAAAIENCSLPSRAACWAVCSGREREDFWDSGMRLWDLAPAQVGRAVSSHGGHVGLRCVCSPSRPPPRAAAPCTHVHAVQGHRGAASETHSSQPQRAISGMPEGERESSPWVTSRAVPEPPGGACNERGPQGASWHALGRNLAASPPSFACISDSGQSAFRNLLPPLATMKGVSSKVNCRAPSLRGHAVTPYLAQPGTPAGRGRRGVAPRADGSGLDGMHKELLQEVGRRGERTQLHLQLSPTCPPHGFTPRPNRADSRAQAQPGGAPREAQPAHRPDVHAHRELAGGGDVTSPP